MATDFDRRLQLSGMSALALSTARHISATHELLYVSLTRFCGTPLVVTHFNTVVKPRAALCKLKVL